MATRDQTISSDSRRHAHAPMAARGDGADPPEGADASIAEAARLRQSLDRLQARLDESQGAEARLQTEVGRFYVSASQLSASISRTAIVDAIREILANLIGSEQIVVLSARSPFSGLASGNEPPEVLYSFAGEGWTGQGRPVRSTVEGVLASGDSFYATGAGDDPGAIDPESGLSACIALRAGDRVVGAIAVFDLLPQKEALTSSDRELCEMVGNLGGQALYCSELHEGFRDGIDRIHVGDSSRAMREGDE
ncbi:MAG: GAF domain-containing protein [Myxococcota bacterium]